MERFKDFMKNISKTGWIIISLGVVIIILAIVGFIFSRDGINMWPFNNSETELSVGNNEDLLANVDRALDSVSDKVVSREDVLNGIYTDSYEQAEVYVRSTQEIPIAVAFDSAKYEGVEGVTKTSCGDLMFVKTRVFKKPGIINETLRMIFEDQVISDFEPGNVISKYHPNLVFENATLENEIAKIYLRGNFSSNEGETCAINLAISQIEETVKKFDTVSDVEIYQNLKKIN